MFQIDETAVGYCSSRKQTCVVLSAYMTQAYSGAQEVFWIRQFLLVLLDDNHAAICMTKNSQFHGRAKHVDIKCRFILEKVCSGVVELK